jgi:sterol desaturase/sphingolipid hydroxylase (fatty acid hydroxylase superfamily)
MRKRFETSADTKGWLLDTFAMGTANYWLAFVADFTTGLFFLGWDLAHGASPLTVAGAFGIGFLLWGLTEYAFHRWIYHQPKGIFGEGHRIHHTEAERLIAMPWFITTSAMFAIWYLVSVRLGAQAFASIVAGWLVGFVWYSLVHHSHHHWNLGGGWVRRLKAYHRVHHHFPDHNYGVTMRFWDIVFGTQYRKPVAARSESETAPAGASHRREPALIDA